jgi:hypothetical protein
MRNKARMRKFKFPPNCRDITQTGEVIGIIGATAAKLSLAQKDRPERLEDLKEREIIDRFWRTSLAS